MKKHIFTCLNLHGKRIILDDQAKWEYLKYKVKKCFIKSSKINLKTGKVFLKKINKKLGSNMNDPKDYKIIELNCIKCKT